MVSNRGPVSFVRESGQLLATRGGGGLVSSLAPLVEGTGVTWIAAAMTDGDRLVADEGVIDVEGFRLRTIAIDKATYRMAYDVIANGTLWFLYHGLFDPPRRPGFDRRWRGAWEGYRRFNQSFAEVVAEEASDGGIVLVQDYHLALLGQWLGKLRPDLRTVHFSHTPFCGPDALSMLPDDVADELLEGMGAFGACGFHSSRWSRAFEGCFRDRAGEAPVTFVAPLAPDPTELADMAGSAEGEAEQAWIDEVVGDRHLLLRVDRIELSKNLLRGFLAYDDLLRTRPEWRGRVVFVALVYPSREALAAYKAYRNEAESVVARINAEWGDGDWTPIVLDSSDNVARSAAALTRYDVLLVNPIRDGLNLVAKEGPLVNRTDGVLVLSREAGVWDELAEGALGLNPFDIVGTSDVLAQALDMPTEERARRAEALRRAASAREPRDWLDDQLAAAGRAPSTSE